MKKQSKLKKISIIYKDNDKFAKETSLEISEYLTRKKFDVSIIENNSKGIAEVEYRKWKNIDLLIVIGGDGTIIKSARMLKQYIPILGIKAGNKGILTEIEPSELPNSIKKIKLKKYHIEKIPKLNIDFGKNKTECAVNEIYIEKFNTTRTPIFNIKTKNDSMDMKMDGVVISTPIGSTGYSLSFGSSILASSIDALLLTPIASISRIPSIIIPWEKITITIPHKTSITIDGQIMSKVPAKQKITITKDINATAFVRFTKSNFRRMKKMGYNDNS